MEILQVENLSFRYNESSVYAVKDVSFSVKEGEFVVLCGESGCGKSTLLKLLKRETAPYGEIDGSIIYRGIPRNEIDNRQSASEIGFVLQNPESQIVTDLVWHELAFGLESLGLETQEIRRKTAEMASYFGIQDWFYKKTSELSGGEKQLLNLASVMVMQPKILMLDEPTAQLDPIAASNFIATLQKLNRELGITVLLIEHRLEEVFPICDRVLIMEQGGIAFNGTPNTVTDFFADKANHPIKNSLPAAMRIFEMLGGKGKAPITVRDGREFIRTNYANKKGIFVHSLSEFESEIAVELENVYFRYERESDDVVKGVSVKINKGEHHCILGGNGTGKTTTLNIIAGLLKPYRGKVYINKKTISDYKNGSLYVKNVAFLPQDPQTVFVEMTVKEDLAEICKTLKYSKEETEERIKAISHKLSISHLLDNHPYDLSGGEQQKAALAKVLLADPKILLLDEPTKGIDATGKMVLGEIIKTLNDEGVTVITVTHDVEFSATTSDKCSLFFDGQIVSSDITSRFFSDNSFYTTAANRIARGYYKNTFLCEHVAEMCRLNARVGEQ